VSKTLLTISIGDSAEHLTYGDGRIISIERKPNVVILSIWFEDSDSVQILRFNTNKSISPPNVRFIAKMIT
jgi:hypothetical protein